MKLANYGDSEQTVSINFGTSASKASLTTLSGDMNAQNDESNPNLIKPVESEIDGKDGQFDVEMPAWSVVVVKTQ